MDYHPVCWDDVRYNEVCVDIDSYPELKISGRKSWAHNKYRLVTHLRLLRCNSRDILRQGNIFCRL